MLSDIAIEAPADPVGSFIQESLREWNRMTGSTDAVPEAAIEDLSTLIECTLVTSGVVINAGDYRVYPFSCLEAMIDRLDVEFPPY